MQQTSRERTEQGQQVRSGRPPTAYSQWLSSTGVPVHRGYYIADLRDIELGAWAERECRAAFLELAGQEGISEARVTEIAPGQTLPPMKFALDEAVYVVDGRGLANVWLGDSAQARTFEWGKYSLFMLPRGCSYQLVNTSGTDRALLLHYNYLPAAMDLNPDPDFFFENPYTSRRALPEDFYAEARTDAVPGASGMRNLWYGNFFPDMRVWDRLAAQKTRGASAKSVSMQFPDSPIWCHMATFPPGTYKKAHRHGPGVFIIIPVGEGYSIMWPEGREKVYLEWHEASVFVPPNLWFHQHFNPSQGPVRYLAFHAPRHTRPSRDRPDPANQIEYPNEDPWIRQTFEEELGKRGLESLMPAEAYLDADYQWEGDDDDD